MPIVHHEWTGIGYKPLVFTPSWMTAILNWEPGCDLQNVSEIEVHHNTDEVFVLWRGHGALYILENGLIQVEDMRPGVIYNVPAGVWHGCLGSVDVSWVIMENRDTHLYDTEVRKLNSIEIQMIHEQAPAWCRDAPDERIDTNRENTG